jgi:hypothetical protein
MPGNKIAITIDTGAITKTLVMIETTIPKQTTDTIINVFSFMLLKIFINFSILKKSKSVT